MNFKLFGKTILVVNIKFGLVFGHPLSQWGNAHKYMSMPSDAIEGAASSMSHVAQPHTLAELAIDRKGFWRRF